MAVMQIMARRIDRHVQGFTSIHLSGAVTTASGRWLLRYNMRIFS